VDITLTCQSLFKWGPGLKLIYLLAPPGAL